MDLRVSTPTAQVRIVTDLDALRESITLTNRINALSSPTANRTEAEAAADARERERLLDDLRETAGRVDASTITLTLQGLHSNEWNQLVTRCTGMDNGRETKDLAKLARLSTPRMLTAVTAPDGTPIEADETAVNGLVDSLTDSQTLELLQTIQELNTPVTSLPKETSALLKSTS